MHMARAHASNAWTLEQLHRLPDDSNKYELVYGELFVTPPPSVRHEELAAILRRILQPYVTAWNLGNIYTPRAVLRALKSEVEPDLMVRQPSNSEDWADLPVPTLVVEAASRSTRKRDIGKKRQFYMDVAVPDYWVVDRDYRVIHVVRPGREDVVAADLVSWQPAGADEPLVVDVDAYFRQALGEKQ
jgi:Uma2 family endonuclease